MTQALYAHMNKKKKSLSVLLWAHPGISVARSARLGLSFQDLACSIFAHKDCSLHLLLYVESDLGWCPRGFVICHGPHSRQSWAQEHLLFSLHFV
jgi:hypothetical protein